MTATVSAADLASLPLPPKNPLPYRQRAGALRSFHSGSRSDRHDSRTWCAHGTICIATSCVSITSSSRRTKDDIADMDQMSGGTVHADDTRTGRAGDDIGL